MQYIWACVKNVTTLFLYLGSLSPSPSPSLCLALARSPSMASSCFSPLSLALSSSPIPKSSVKRRQWKPIIKALKEWREYEDAVRDKDLARALRFLKSMEALQLQSSPSPSHPSSVNSVTTYSPGFAGSERDWEVLDTCLNADDMRLVGSAYSFLQDRGFLPNFGKCKNIGTGFFSLLRCCFDIFS